MRNTSAVPQVTYALIAINVIVFLAEGNSLDLTARADQRRLSHKGALLGSNAACYPARASPTGSGGGIITSGFLHENLLHIGFNMYVLYFLGQMLEPAIGRFKFGLLYFVSLLAGSLGALIVSPHALTVGASGADLRADGRRGRGDARPSDPHHAERRRRPDPHQPVISFTLPGISWGGHVGGLIGGAIAAHRPPARQPLPLPGRWPSSPACCSARPASPARSPSRTRACRIRSAAHAARPESVSAAAERAGSSASASPVPRAPAPDAGCAPAARARRSAAGPGARSRRRRSRRRPAPASSPPARARR